MKNLARYRNSRTWNAWRSMKARCTNPETSNYSEYGGRGITVCAEWNRFAEFLEDMGECPPEHSLDRIDNDKGYSVYNCRWATRRTQTLNSRIRKDNTSGLKGVYRENSIAVVWIANYIDEVGQRIFLYRGSDFFEACCARKSWEAAQ